MAAPSGRVGLTLVEMLLALTLLTVMLGLGIVSLSGALRAARTEENAGRFVSLLRAVRSEAANTGRRFRIGFDEDTSQPVVSFEPDALGEPGTFQPYHAWWVDLARLEEGVRVVLCERTGMSAFSPVSASSVRSVEDDGVLEELTFQPNGASDSARIVLANDDEQRPWCTEITLNGVDGTIRTRQIDTEEEPIEPSR